MYRGDLSALPVQDKRVGGMENMSFYASNAQVVNSMNPQLILLQPLTLPLLHLFIPAVTTLSTQGSVSGHVWRWGRIKPSQ